MGTFIVDDLAGNIAPATLTINAKSADMLGEIRSQRTRHWTQVTLNDIVARIAGDHGLTPRLSQSLRNTRYSYLAQTTESDLNFLSRLAKDLDATVKPAGDFLVFLKRGEALTADGQPLPKFTYDITDLSSGSWQQNGRGKFNSVVAEWGNISTATPETVTAGEGTPKRVLKHRYATQEEASRAARSALEKAKRESGKISIHLGGFDGTLMAEATVTLTGIKPELTGAWRVTRVRHDLGATLTTSFDAERDIEEQ